MTRQRHRFANSSRLVSGRYDPATRTVELLFPDGARVDYLDVPADVWQQLTEAESPGRYLREVLEHYAYRPR